jgi:hypothetical protein
MTDAGVVLASAAALFTARVVYEQTFLTWTEGVEMAGYVPPQFAMDWVGLGVLVIGSLWAIVIAARSLLVKSRISTVNRLSIALLIVCLALWLVPYQQWKLLMVAVHGSKSAPKSWLASAAALGEIRLVDYLLSNGVDVDSRARFGESPLAAAAATGQIEAARILIARGARLDNRTSATFETPLTEAAQMNHTAMVKLLLDHGANPSARDIMNRSALDWAEINENLAMVQLIRAHPAASISRD